MAQALATMPGTEHPDLLVGYNQADDAGVFRISDNLALVQTVDFFPPIVDDPYQFGQIAAANALSDVYAMGGRPITALNIVAFPAGKMPPEILTEILRGGAEKVREAGAIVVGGHSISDQELKYGIAVTGLIDPKHIISNAGAQPGDLLYLSKPLGTGLITTAIKRKAVGSELAKIVSAQMAQLNRAAADLMIKYNAHAATDVTGFGLLGHAYEMAAASSVSIKISTESLPLMPEALRLADAQMIPGGAIANRDYLSDKAIIDENVSAAMQAVLFDPQTSGGLLIALSPEQQTEFEKTAESDRIAMWLIGSVESVGEYPLIVE